MTHRNFEGQKPNKSGFKKQIKETPIKEVSPKKEETPDQVINTGDALISALQDQLQCSICLELMKVPTSVVPCLHTYCKSCIEGCITYQGRHCPICREVVTETRKNTTLAELIESIQKK